MHKTLHRLWIYSGFKFLNIYEGRRWQQKNSVCCERVTLRNLNLKMKGSGEYCEEASISNAKSESVTKFRREVANRLTLTGESSSN